jgi:hypothetical protein
VEAYSYTFRSFVRALAAVNHRIKAYSDSAESNPCLFREVVGPSPRGGSQHFGAGCYCTVHGLTSGPIYKLYFLLAYAYMPHSQNLEGSLLTGGPPKRGLASSQQVACFFRSLAASLNALGVQGLEELYHPFVSRLYRPLRGRDGWVGSCPEPSSNTVSGKGAHL